MKISLPKNKILKFLKYLLITASSLFLLFGSFLLFILNSNYNLQLPHFIKGQIEKRITNYIGGRSTQISSINISKQDNQAIHLIVRNLTTLSKEQKKILNSDLLNVKIDISSLSKAIKIIIAAKDVFIDIDNIAILPRKSKGSNLVAFDSLNKIIRKFLRISYIQLSDFHLTELNIIRKQKREVFNINYNIEQATHNLDIIYANFKSSKMAISASNNNDNIIIAGEIIKFPLWFFVEALPEEFHTDFTKDLHGTFLVNGNLKYNSSSNKDHDFSFNITKDKRKIDQNIIKDLIINVSNRHTNSTIFINDFRIVTQKGGEFSSKGQLQINDNFLDKKLVILMDIHLNKIPTELIGYFWPIGAQSETREWITTRFKKGMLNKATCKLNFKDVNKIYKDDLHAYIDFDSLELDYYNDHNPLTNLAGTANFNLESVHISIEKGKLLSSNIEPSYIEIEYNKSDIPITIKASANGNIKDFFHFMGQENYKKLTDKGIDLTKSSGKLNTSVFIKSSIEKEFSFDDSVIDIKAKINNFQTELYDKIFLTNGELNLDINNKFFVLAGPVNINDQQSNFEWVAKFNPTKEEFNTKFTINSVITDNSNFEEIFNNKFRILDGKAFLNTVYYENNGKENIQVNFDLDEAYYYLPSLGITKEKKIPSSLTIELARNEGQDWYSKILKLNSEDGININGDLIANYDFAEIKKVNLNLNYPETDFSINFTQDDINKKLNITGKKINLSDAHISELFSNNQFISPTETTTSKVKNLNLNIDLKQARMNHGIFFSNIKGEFNCYNMMCKKSNLTLGIGENSELKIWQEIINNKIQWHLYANDASTLLKGLGAYNDLEGGELTITMWNVAPGKVLLNPNSVFVGEVNMKNFKAIKNPILTKLVSFTSIMGILNIFTNMNKIPFSNLDGHFVFADNVLRINRVNAVGEYLTLTMNGTVDWNYDDIDIYGKVIPPVYGFNYLLAMIPFIGHKTAGGQGKGLVAADYSITGKIGDTQTFVNPLAIIMPDIFTFWML